MKYKDLNLKKIREEHDLDFAHFTYQPGMCSCCYGPSDLPKRYWKDGVVRDDDDYTYILFKNADNGSGHVKRNDEIEHGTVVSWYFPIEKLVPVCKSLQEQLGDEYIVLVPPDSSLCIKILTDKNIRLEGISKEDKSKGYTLLADFPAIRYFKQSKESEKVKEVHWTEAMTNLKGVYKEEFVDELFDKAQAFRLQTPFAVIWTEKDGLIPAPGFFGVCE